MDTLYSQYLLIKNEMPWNGTKNQTGTCQAILEDVYALLNPDHWKVIRIRRTAFDYMLNNVELIKRGKNKGNVRINLGKIKRAHINLRRETFLTVMNKSWNNGEEIMSYIKSRDLCCLSLENNKVMNDMSDDIVVPSELKLFMPQSIGMCAGQKEYDWLCVQKNKLTNK